MYVTDLDLKPNRNDIPDVKWSIKLSTVPKGHSMLVFTPHMHVLSYDAHISDTAVSWNFFTKIFGYITILSYPHYFTHAYII